MSKRSLIVSLILAILGSAGWNSTATPPIRDPRCANIRQATTTTFVAIISDAIRTRDECISTLGQAFCKDQVATVIAAQKIAHKQLAKTDATLCAEMIAHDERQEAERKAQDVRATAELKKQCLALQGRLQAQQAWKTCVHGRSWPTMAELEAQCGRKPTPSLDDSDLYERCEFLCHGVGEEYPDGSGPDCVPMPQIPYSDEADDGGIEGGVLGGILGGVDGGMNDQPLYAGIGGVSNPELIPSTKVPPIYPKASRKAKVPGQVVLQIVVHKDGTVGDAIVLKSPGEKLGFDEAAIAAVKQWRYKPSLQNGKPVDVYFTIVVSFVLPAESR